MQVPTTKKLIDDFRAGKVSIAAIPVPPTVALSAGKNVVFREAIFDGHGIPAYVPNGDRFAVTLTRAKDSGTRHGNSSIYTIEWGP